MSERNKTVAAQVESEQLNDQLQEIKERISTLESLQIFVHRDDLVGMVTNGLGENARKKALLRFCSEPRTRSEMATHLGVSTQLLDHTLRPLREEGLLEETTVNRTKAYTQSRLVRKVSKASLERILG